MRLVFLLVLLIGILIAGFAGYTAMGVFADYGKEIKRLEKLAAKNVSTGKVVIVAKPLKFGKRLERKDVKTVRFPVSAIPDNAFRSIEEVFGKKEDEKEPRAVLRVMEPKEILSKSKVSDFGEDAKETFTRLILDGIDLLAIDQISDADRNRPYVARTVTVAVTPQVVAALAQAQATGKLQLSLRGTNDTEATGQINFTQNDLLGREEAAKKKKRKVCTIKSRKGAEVKTIEIPCPAE